MNTVKRAVILAAGFGSRLYPLTADTPKTMLSIGDGRIIDTILDALYLNGINEIYIVTGYLSERFKEIRESHPSVRLLYNPAYGSSNNITSLYAAREYLSDCVVLESDLIIKDPHILQPEFEHSLYFAVSPPAADEWGLKVSDGIIERCWYCATDEAQYRLYGISMWSDEDGKRLSEAVRREVEDNRRTDNYWDYIPLFWNRESFHLGIREVAADSIEEIDTVDEYNRLRSRAAAVQGRMNI